VQVWVRVNFFNLQYLFLPRDAAMLARSWAVVHPSICHTRAL